MYSVDDICYVETAFSRFYDIGAAEGGGVTRLGYTEEEDEMHAVFSSLGEKLGLDISTDEAGNTFACNRKGDGGYYLIGSHLDSVVGGGRYDGVAGILAGLLVMRWAARDGAEIPLRAAAFRCEESSNFGVCTLGSALVTGGARETWGALEGKSGRTLGEIFAAKGYSLAPPQIAGVREYLELHIEQGRVLEEYGQRVGIVTTIAAPRRFRLHIQGRAEHSGATPMAMRNDALCAAAELILEIERIGVSESARGSVATVGMVINKPNVLNVIPGEVQLHVDTRGVEPESLDEMERRIRQAGRDVCARRKAGFIREKISDAKPVEMDHKMRDKLTRAARRANISHREMASGAGHDAMRFAEICDTAMVFVPCKGGISHNKNEFAHMESICDGARVIYEYLREECARNDPD